MVERGEIELECLAGNRLRCGAGAVLWLVGLPLRALHNRGSETAVLAAVSSAAMSFRRRPQSIVPEPPKTEEIDTVTADDDI